MEGLGEVGTFFPLSVALHWVVRHLPDLLSSSMDSCDRRLPLHLADGNTKVKGYRARFSHRAGSMSWKVGCLDTKKEATQTLKSGALTLGLHPLDGVNLTLKTLPLGAPIPSSKFHIVIQFIGCTHPPTHPKRRSQWVRAVSL